MNNNRRVLIVGNFLSQTGKMNKSVCEELAPNLEIAGWTVLTTSRQPRRLLRVLDMLWTVWRFRSSYDIAQVDVFSGPSFVWAVLVCWMLRQLHKPYVLTLRGGNLPAFAQYHPNGVRHLLALATKVTAPSRYLCEQMSAYRPDIVLLPNPLELGSYSFQERVRPKPQLVWLRAFNNGYNPTLAAKGVALLKDDFPDIHLLMIGRDKGDGSFQAFQQMVENLGIGNLVDCPGPIAKSDVPSWLNNGDVFLNTTNVDNTPVSVMEAMACGLCVVSTDVGGIPYLLDHEQDALLVPPNDPGALADAVRSILTEPDLAARLSRNARRKAEQFDWNTILPQWETLLVEALRGERGRKA